MGTENGSILASPAHATMAAFYKTRIFVVLTVLISISDSRSYNVTWVSSYNYSPQRLDKTKGTVVDKPTILVLHYTVSDLNRTFATFQTNGTVSSHYTVAENGDIYQHVDERYRAWHAGVGSWGSVRDVNTYSIGIEIVNAGFRAYPFQPPGTIVPGSPVEWYPFKPKQIEAVIELSSDIVKRYGIKPQNVIAHSDLAPGRKEDPGPLFPWEKLAQSGVGAWVETNGTRSRGNESDVLAVQKKLRKYGYSAISPSGTYDNDTRKGIAAFQMHFRQTNIGGKIDDETVGILDALLRKYRD